MTDEKIIENYKQHCTNLKSAEMLSGQDYRAIQELEQFIQDGKVKPKDVIKAFKMANKSKFLSGQVNNFKASISWMCNPVNIDKVLSGKYDDKPKKASFNFDGEEEKQLELEQHLKNQERLKKIRTDKKHQE